MHSLMLTIAKSNILYDNGPLMENITAWISVMSATPNRPFRHTATVAALTIVSALCEVGRDLADVGSKLTRQIEGEKKKRGSNKGRIAEMENNVKANAKKEEVLKDQLTLWFDAVFVHRYRDVDHHIRLDCMQALGDWICTYPDIYFDGSYLRYFGWVLSDLSAPTRLEVLKALTRLYKDSEKLHGLRAFTERFRPRIIEMATRDSDPGVRTTAIELIDLLREAGFLEPTDIDEVGKLIFDSEPRVRKAVVNFFAQNVDDLYETRLEEDLGGLEAVEEIFGGDVDSEDYDSPRVEWLKLKCLLEILAAYDAQDEVNSREMIPIPETETYVYIPGMESRFSLAAEGLCDRMSDLKWEILAGYLLYDHSQTAITNGASANADPMSAFKREVKLTEKEEMLLLEILNASVKLDMSQTVHHDKKTTKAQRQAEAAALEDGSRHLAALIPRLLNKFGALPEAASAILRLEHVIRPESQDFSTYNTLLEDIKKQFQTHAEPSVLQQASKALLHARIGEAEESAQAQVTNLAEDAIQKFMNLLRSKSQNVRGLGIRGSLDEDRLAILHGAVLRLEMLGSIEDICTLLESPMSINSKAQAPTTPVDTLIEVMRRGIPTTSNEDDLGSQEDSVVLRTARALSFYFMWKVRTVSKMVSSAGLIPPSTLQALQKRKEKFTQVITDILSSRTSADEIRLVLAPVMVDLFVAFAGLVHIKPAKRPTRKSNANSEQDGEEEDSSKSRAHLVLVSEIPKATQALLLQILSSAEKAYAKRTKRTLEDADETEEPGIDDEPEDSDDDDEPMEDVDDDAGKEAKLAADLVTEQRLCDLASGLVLGIWAAVLDGKQEGGKDMVRKRLRRNRAKLGPNFKACVEALDRGGPLAGSKAAAKKATAATKKKAAVSKAIIVESDEEEDEDQADGGQDEEIMEDSPEVAVSEKAAEESVLGD
jgi:cohesin complex subunit SA-1/2